MHVRVVVPPFRLGAGVRFSTLMLMPGVIGVRLLLSLMPFVFGMIVHPRHRVACVLHLLSGCGPPWIGESKRRYCQRERMDGTKVQHSQAHSTRPPNSSPEETVRFRCSPMPVNATLAD
jgi:hypothetical protein